MKTLLQHFNNCSKKDLIQIAKYHKMKGYSSLNKAQLAEKLADYITSQEVFPSYFTYLSAEEIALLCRKENTSNTFAFGRLIEGGYCFKDKDHQDHFFIPEDLPIHQLEEHSFQAKQKHCSLIADLAQYAANVYGCASLTILCKMYQTYTKKQISPEQLAREITQIPTSINPVVILHDLCIHKDFIPNDLYQKIQLCQGSVPYYIPPVEVFQHFLRQGYFKDEYTQKLLDHFITHMKLTPDLALSTLIQLQSQFRQGGNLEEAGNYLREHGIISDMDIDKTLLSLLNSMFSHSRLLFNRGYSESEKVAMFKPAASKSTKIYPNHPCPCGSGKKYKKCCGRK